MNSPQHSSVGAAPSSFVFAGGREPHAARAKEILKAHAEIRKLAGRNPWSGVLIVALVAFQTDARMAAVGPERSGSSSSPPGSWARSRATRSGFSSTTARTTSS